METEDSPGAVLCKACGLCCSGHLFVWVKLRPGELDAAEEFGLKVHRSDPAHRGFDQPCPLWNGLCTIYQSSNYPHTCRAYKCTLLKELAAEQVSLPDALARMEQVRGLIRELEALLPIPAGMGFREYLVSCFEHPGLAPSGLDYRLFHLKAGVIFIFFQKVFGVKDLFEKK